MSLNGYGKIAEDCWNGLPKHYTNIGLDTFVIMPNHVHGIVLVGAGFKPALSLNANGKIIHPGQTGAGLKPAPTCKNHCLSEIVRSFKAFSFRQINKIRNSPSVPVWQRNYYEHIIRNEAELNKIREYIFNNPQSWESDENYMKG